MAWQMAELDLMAAPALVRLSEYSAWPRSVERHAEFVGQQDHLALLVSVVRGQIVSAEIALAPMAEAHFPGVEIVAELPMAASWPVAEVRPAKRFVADHPRHESSRSLVCVEAVQTAELDWGEECFHRACSIASSQHLGC